MPHNDAAPAPAPDHVELRLRQQELAACFGLFALGQDELQPVLDEACRVAARGLGVHHAKLPGRDSLHQQLGLRVSGV